MESSQELDTLDVIWSWLENVLSLIKGNIISLILVSTDHKRDELPLEFPSSLFSGKDLKKIPMGLYTNGKVFILISLSVISFYS